MSDTDPRNNLAWRVTVLERQVGRLEEGKPDVIAERVTRLSGDIDHLRRDVNTDIDALRAELRDRARDQGEELATQRKILISAFVSIAGGLILAYVLGGGGVPA